MTAAPHQWSTTAADNRSADTRAKFPTGMPASALDDAVTALMQSGALARDDRLGVLAATVNSGNVFTVQTNEGLIDPATQVGGATGKITKPFIIRAVLPAMPTPVTTTAPTNAPTIIIDGAAAVPLLRRDGSVPVDKDFAGLVYEILGDRVTGGSYSRARILDALPSDTVAAASGPVFGGRLVCTGPTELRLMTGDSNQFFVNGKMVTIPAAGIPISNSGQSGTGDLYTYLDATGALSFDASPVVSPTYGNLVDPTAKTKSLVGYTRLGFTTAGQFAAAGTLSRYCRRDRVTMGPVFGASLSTAYQWLSGSFTPFVCWEDEHVDVSWDGWEAQATQGTGLYNYSRLGVDNTVLTNPHTSGGAAYQNSGDGSRWGGPLAAGLHTAMVSAYSNVAGSVTTGQMLVKVRG